MQPSPIAKASNPYTKPQARHPGSLLKGYANGGAIEGPGTATSDSIPAKVKQTGEPIQVANGERIVSADQDALLLRIAKAMGHKSVDEMFQAGTGKPVGPTVKYGKKHAAGGANPYDLMKNKIGRAPDGLTLQDAAAASTSNGYPAQVPDPASAIGPTPAASLAPTERPSTYGQQMANVGGFLLKAPAEAIKTVVSAPGYGISQAMANTPEPAAAPAASPLVAPGASMSASEMAKRQTQLPAEAAAIATAPPVSPILGNTEGVSAGNGITRFDTPGKSPLFTNMTDAAGLADNAKLQARAPVTAQNQGAMDGIQARQDARDQGARNKMQYDKEVAGAQAVNDAGERLNLEYSLRNGNPQERASAMVLLNAANATAKDLRGNAVVTRGQDITANASSQTNKLAQNKDTREGKAFELQQQSVEQQAALTKEYMDSKTTPERKAQIAELMMLGKRSGPNYAHTTGGQIVDPVTGQVTQVPGRLYNVHTGEEPPVKAVQGAVKAPPKVGDVVSGHKFKGGNPADQKNWEKV